jgi:hypothetical protein
MVACKITAAKDDNGKLGEVTFGNGGGTTSVGMARLVRLTVSASLGRWRLSRTDRGDPRIRSPNAGFHPARCRYKAQIVDEVAWAKNLTKSKVRAKVEHVFQVLKLRFGFVKVRYRGLKKNAHRLFVTSALVNLFVSRKKLLLARV